MIIANNDNNNSRNNICIHKIINVIVKSKVLWIIECYLNQSSRSVYSGIFAFGVCECVCVSHYFFSLYSLYECLCMFLDICFYVCEHISDWCVAIMHRLNFQPFNSRRLLPFLSPRPKWICVWCHSPFDWKIIHFPVKRWKSNGFQSFAFSSNLLMSQKAWNEDALKREILFI